LENGCFHSNNKSQRNKLSFIIYSDLVVLGFQEIVELNPKQVIIGGNSIAIS
jgi:hypothetical protein